MTEYEDLFKKQESDVNPVISRETGVDPEAEIGFLRKNQRINRLILITYVAVSALVSLLSRAFVDMKYPNTTLITNNIEVVVEPTFTLYDSGDAVYPYGIAISGQIMNANAITLPNLWFSVDLLTENGDLIDSILIEADQVGTGGTLEIDYSGTYADPIYSHTAYEIGFDESDLFYILLNLSTVLICSLVFMVIDKSGFARDWKTFRTTPGKHIGMIIGGWVMVYAALFIASFLLQIIGVSDTSANEDAIAGMFSTDLLSIGLLFLLLCVFTPIAEELVFRKVIYGFFDRKWGVVPAVILSGAVFGLMHVVAYGDFIQSIPYIFMGSVFGYVYHWSAKNIYVTIGVHFINNLISFLFYVFLAFGLSI